MTLFILIDFTNKKAVTNKYGLTLVFATMAKANDFILSEIFEFKNIVLPVEINISGDFFIPKFK